MLLVAIGDSLPIAVGVALSPVPIAAVVTILLSARPKNAPYFLLGWLIGILLIGLVVFLIPGLDTAGGEPTALSGWIRLVIGSVLLVLAVRQWQQRPSVGDPVEVPKVLSKLDAASTMQTVAIGFLLSALNPKNLLLTFAGAASIYASGATPSQKAIAFFVYAVVASLSVALPIIGYRLFTEQVQSVLADWKDWLIRNNAAVVCVLLIVFGTLIIGNGLKILAA